MSSYSLNAEISGDRPLLPSEEPRNEAGHYAAETTAENNQNDRLVQIASADVKDIIDTLYMIQAELKASTEQANQSQRTMLKLTEDLEKYILLSKQVTEKLVGIHSKLKNSLKVCSQVSEQVVALQGKSKW